MIFLFLRNVSATIIPSLALPMSIIGTFAVMYLLDYSLDNLSLMALTLAVGFVVDDAIVVLENIVRHMELGEKPYEAAVKGAQEIGFTIVTMTISLVECFYPCAVYERHARPDTAGIFRHHLRRDSGFGLYLVKSYSHACQPLSASARTIRSMAGCIVSSAAVWMQ